MGGESWHATINCKEIINPTLGVQSSGFMNSNAVNGGCTSMFFFFYRHGTAKWTTATEVLHMSLGAKVSLVFF